jgi:hypothetical protein
MANTLPCSGCKHYDPILKGMKPTPRGWCVKKSLYPHRDTPGQVTPDGARRVGPDETLAKPYIVDAASVQTACTTYVAKPPAKTKAGLQALAKGLRK